MPPTPTDELLLEPNPHWYQDAVIYELHVRAFADSDGDGIGDFRGLTRKLDYLQDLGVTALWLLPFYPSPLRDDGYDIADYTSVHPDYGTLEDFRTFLDQAHKRGLRVITELVLNHTSDQHPWFQRARRAEPGSRWRDTYVWSDTPDRYAETRVIFQDFEASNWSWDPVAQSYYWHRFYSHQPDLNFDNPEVRETMLQLVDDWLAMGVDGLRLDAVPYLYEREGTNCENLPETHEFLKDLRARVDEKFGDKMLLAEANQWPEDAIAYFGDGDECHMNFHFPLMPRLFMSIRMEDRFPIIDILDQTPPIPDDCQWAIFLRNHDELTLEMVTDEERDYMYRVYASEPRARLNLGIRRRLAPLLENNRRKIELMNGLLFSLPGTPVLYYGDEIGMGDNIYLGDRNGVRTPMQWSPDRNAGFSNANPQKLYLPPIIDPEYHYESLNVEAQQNNPSSLLWWMKRLIGIRKRFRAFGRGRLEFLSTDNRKVLAFVRKHEDEVMLVVANLSRFTQCSELDLGAYRGMVPREIFGQTTFPPIGELPYFITLGPHAFHWFSLEPQHAERHRAPGDLLAEVDVTEEGWPTITVADAWEDVLQGRPRQALEAALPRFLAAARWFGGKARKLKSIEIRDAVPVEDADAYIALVDVDYIEGDPDVYAVPLAFATGERAEQLQTYHPEIVICRLRLRAADLDGVLYDALRHERLGTRLLDGIAHGERWSGARETISASPVGLLDIDETNGSLAPALSHAEQSNSSIVYGQRYILKLYRRLEAGVNPDLEITRALTEQGFPHIPPAAGYLEIRRDRRSEPMTLGLLQAFVPNEGDAWSYTQDVLGQFYEHVLSQPVEATREGIPAPPRSTLSVVNGTTEDYPDDAYEMVGSFMQSAERLGQRTAELHTALASRHDDPSFAPEPINRFAQRSIYQSIRSSTRRTIQFLHQQLEGLPEALRPQAQAIMDAEDDLLGRLRSVLESRIQAKRIRTHGDFHLGQVLYTGKDFVILDFEGEPARPLGERRLKRSPLRDVAGMLRSFHYAAHASLFSLEEGGILQPNDRPRLEPWARFWTHWVCVAFLKVYRATIQATPGLIPDDPDALHTLLDAYLLEKAIYELNYELNNRPDWVQIPLQGIADLLAHRDARVATPENGADDR